MTTPSDPALMARLVRQHASTLQYMGVSFMPLGEAQDMPETLATPAAQEHTIAAASAPSAFRSATGASQPVLSPAARPESARAESAPLLPLVIEPKPDVPAVQHTDPDRIAAQRVLDEIRARYEREAPHQHFVTDHHCIVFGEGDPRAKLMFVGEAPGAEEDKVGRPFVGRAGQLLDKMIVAMGLRRQDVYIANVLKTRPPNNATPTMDECARCAPFLHAQIAAVRPEVIVTLGLPATRVLLNSMESMSRLRGQWATFTPPEAGGRTVPVMPTYHPAFLLRAYTKENRQKVWSDLQLAAQRIGLAAPSGASTGAE